MKYIKKTNKTINKQKQEKYHTVRFFVLLLMLNLTRKIETPHAHVLDQNISNNFKSLNLAYSVVCFDLTSILSVTCKLTATL
jgi:hypothetical protein